MNFGFKLLTIQLQNLSYCAMMRSTGSQKEYHWLAHYQKQNKQNPAFSKGMEKGLGYSWFIPFYFWKEEQGWGPSCLQLGILSAYLEKTGHPWQEVFTVLERAGGYQFPLIPTGPSLKGHSFFRVFLLCLKSSKRPSLPSSRPPSQMRSKWSFSNAGLTLLLFHLLRSPLVTHSLQGPVQTQEHPRACSPRITRYVQTLPAAPHSLAGCGRSREQSLGWLLALLLPTSAHRWRGHKCTTGPAAGT